MKLQSRSKEEPEVNLTSLIDVVLLLLVFFMVSTSFVRETDINLRLPQADAASAPVSDSETLEIVISQTGNYAVDGRALINNQERTLRAAIEKLTDGKRDMPVVIRADALATHQSVVTAMDVAGQLGFVNISIATVKSSDR
jgi:biopolymer transport protein ExbD